MLARRRALFPEVAAAAARAAERHLLGAAELIRARRVALYAALAEELATAGLFHGLAKAGKVCLLPRVEPGRRLVFCAVDRWEDLRPGTFGVSEPPEGCPVVRPGPGDLVIAPGLAFDAEGWRLGWGGGHYDRTFPPDAAEAPLLFGLAFELQVVESVPHGSRDRRMDAIVTERGIRRVARAAP
jgi:5-formyltetrahydrofolate cyclo-ligase